MIRTLIIEDEKLAREVLVDYHKQVPFLQLAGTFNNPLEALPTLGKQQVDLLFLDIHMPGIDGIRFLENFPKAPPVIFTTAYGEHALKGYEFQTLDYLLKPIAFERFLKACLKAKQHFDSGSNMLSSNPTEASQERVLVLQDGSRWFRIPWDDIRYVESDRGYLTIHSSQAPITVIGALRELVTRLSDPEFLRVHKSFLVNLNYARLIERHRLKVEELWIPVGRTFRANLVGRMEREV